ncbi:PP2C family protein-serine/threonine phosphatase [Streptomyces sp. NPDC001984]|uniref:PP2C family protein-serine/threonine phosphatase n=1 Tax=Streptomyces sp. NPDC002619 TaxID=3364655 RepID=UPI00368FE303
MDDFEVDDAVQRALDRLTLLAEVTTALSSTLEPYEGLLRACRIVVPQLADWCAVDLLDEGGRPCRACFVHRDPETLPPEEPADLLALAQDASADPLARVLRGSGPVLIEAGSGIVAPDQAADPQRARQPELFDQLGAHTAAVAPLRARRQVVGALTVARTGDRAPLTESDLALVEDLAHRIALAVDNARLYRETQHIAERLQRSLLPTLPRTGPLRLAGRYVPAAATAEVGGDWYDSFTLPMGQTTLIVGDVTGHDIRAAITMSQLRNMLRGIGCDRQEPPGEILRRLDLAHHTLYPDATASCVYALLQKDEDGSWALQYASAGHLPPLLITHDGTTHYLEGGCGLLLGVDPDVPRLDATEPLPSHSTVLLYTDGLIERRGEDIDAGLTRLRQHAGALVHEPLDAFCEQLLTALTTDCTDDVALLAARVPGPEYRRRTLW